MYDNMIRKTLVALSDAEIRFVVCGGVACVLQGVARATHALDIRLALEDTDLHALVAVVRSLGLRPRIPEPLDAILDPERRRVWIEEKHAVVYTLTAPSGAFALVFFCATRSLSMILQRKPIGLMWNGVGSWFPPSST